MYFKDYDNETGKIVVNSTVASCVAWFVFAIIGKLKNFSDFFLPSKNSITYNECFFKLLYFKLQS